MKKPLTEKEIPQLPNEAERCFAQLFFDFGLHHDFNLVHEPSVLSNPDTLEKSLPDFEIVPKVELNYKYAGGFIELTTKRLDTPKKKRQRRAVLGWLRHHPNYFHLELTYEILQDQPDFAQSIQNIFKGLVSPESLQGKISALINHH